MHKNIRAAAVAAGAAFMMVSSMQVAHAATQTFGTVTVSDDGRAKGSWTIDNSNGTRVKVAGQSLDLQPGGNSIYWKADIYSSSGLCFTANGQLSCNQDWYGNGTLSGTHWNSGSWKSSTRYRDADATSKSQRAGLRACEDIKLWVDPCSSASLTKGMNN